MKLQQLHPDPQHEQNRIKEIEYLLAQPSYQELRPCDACDRPCPCSNSPTCTCMCGPDCEHASLALSSEPDRYPLEEKIVSLVFAFSCLRVCPPYWSCEGHRFPDGDLYRVPQVWFYSRSLIYPKMIGDYLFNLEHNKTIKNHWHICLAYADNSLEAGFSIEPDVKTIAEPDLETMQQDVKVIADNFATGLKGIAQDYIAKYKQHQNN